MPLIRVGDKGRHRWQAGRPFPLPALGESGKHSLRIRLSRDHSAYLALSSSIAAPLMRAGVNRQDNLARIERARYNYTPPACRSLALMRADSLLQFPNATEFMDNGNIRCSALYTHAHRFAAAAEPGAAASFGHPEQSCFDRLAGGLPRQRDDYSLNSSGTPCSHQNPAPRHIVGTEHHRLD
jgi:hypothetical protein